MQPVSSTPIVLLLFLLLLWRGPYRGLPLLWLTLPLGAMAAFDLPALGGASIVVADLAVVAMAGLLVARRGGMGEALAEMRLGRPGFFIVTLFLYATIATLFFPRIFAGATEVFGMSRIAGISTITIRPLAPGNGNITQLLRLLLGFALYLILVALMMRRPDPRPVLAAIRLATLAHLALGLLDLATFATGTSWIMAPFRTANYAITGSHVMAGLKRMIGGFPEASAFGYFALGLFGFWLRYWLDGGRTRGDSLFLLIATFLVLRSTSSSTYVAMMAFLLVVLGMQLWRMGAGQGVPQRVAGFLVVLLGSLPLLATAGFVTYELHEGFRGFLDRALLTKLQTSSGLERMSWNTQAWRNFLETNLMGAGLGSVRASNWFIACLASVGLPGTLLYLSFLGSVAAVRAPEVAPETRLTVSALKSGALALLLASVIVRTSPNLEHQFYAFAGLAVGLALGAARLVPLAPRLNDLSVARAG